MGLFSRIKTLWYRLFSGSYPWPAQDISLPGGRELHLVGSIHMGTRDMSPLPPRLLKKIRQADALIVEADVSLNDSPFRDLPTCPPLEQRLSESLMAELEKRTQELGISLSALTTQPLWQIAMVLQATQAQQLGLRADYGIDFQLLRAARREQVKIIELEGTADQIALLHNLDDGGMALLEDSLSHWHTNARLLQLMISWWLEHPPTQSGLALPNTFSEPLYDVLMHQRNQRWSERLKELPPGRYVVAVGALHLYGSGNLGERLK